MTIYQELMLEEAIFRIGINPYVVLSSDDNKLLQRCINEILKRIVDIKVLYNYPHLFEDYTTPDWLTKILMVECKNIILMNFNKFMEERMNSSESYSPTNLFDSIHPGGTMYDVCVYDQMVAYREYLRIASIIVPCSNKLSNAYAADLSCYAQVFYLDRAEALCIYGNDEDEIKSNIKSFRKIDYNARYRRKIEKHLF